MEKSDKLNVREWTAGIQGAGASGASCDGSPKVSNSSPLVSPTVPINIPRGMYNVDVAATFGVPLTTVGDLDVLTKDIEAGKHEELLSGMTIDKRKEVMDALVAMCDSIQATNTNADAIPCVVSHVDDSTIVDALVAENLNGDESSVVHSIFIQDKPSSYIAAAGGSRPKSSVVGGSKLDPSITKANFRLEDVLENNPWMIRNNPIILKKWSMSTRLSKKELTRIPVWVKIHDVPIHIFSEDGFSIIASQICKPIMLDSYTSSMCIESWGGSNFACCLIEINVKDVLKKSLTIGVPLIE
ncbi:zinc knuckle CX2CX4HX4C containing protein, partial [Tanacetum coccineum]